MEWQPTAHLHVSTTFSKNTLVYERLDLSVAHLLLLDALSTSPFSYYCTYAQRTRSIQHSEIPDKVLLRALKPEKLAC